MQNPIHLTPVTAVAGSGHSSRSESVLVVCMVWCGVVYRIICGITPVVAVQDVGHQRVYLLVVCVM